MNFVKIVSEVAADVVSHRSGDPKVISGMFVVNSCMFDACMYIQWINYVLKKCVDGIRSTAVWMTCVEGKGLATVAISALRFLKARLKNVECLKEIFTRT